MTVNKKILTFTLLLISSFTFCQDWNVTESTLVISEKVYNNVYLNGHTITILNAGSLSARNVYGFGTIRGQGIASLAICNYSCDVVFDLSEFLVYSVPENCDTTLGIQDYEFDILREGYITVYSLTGQRILHDKFTSRFRHRLKKNVPYIAILTHKGKKIKTIKFIIR